METPSSSSSQPNRNAVNGASKFLVNLPSRGFLSSAVLSSNPGGMRVYVCEHDTTPPEGQHIKTNQTNILIRSLQLKKQKGDSGSKDSKGASSAESSRKRYLERLDGRASAKRSNSQTSRPAEGSDSRTADRDLYSLTVERLRALLKEQGLSPKGKKDELVARLRNTNG